MFQPILRALTSRWVLTAFGLVAAGSTVWLFGPLLSGLEGTMPRVAALGVMSMLWLSVNAAIDHARRAADHRLSAGVTQAAPSAGGGRGADDVAEQRDRLTQAMKLLRQARGTRGYLYEQPWYVIIGPPGSGKTTALANSGLRFPFAAELAGGEVRGVGGTQFCDWSFTDEAVLIDTAGRYTTQDSDAATDKEGWEGFLALLRRTRPRQPLNGVIVAISITEIAQAPEAERQAHARAIRSRIKELYTKLGSRMPVYAVFTKVDLIQGFTDFFDHFDREHRGQVWGMTFPTELGPQGPVGDFPAEFHALTEQLSVRVIDRLQTERSPERRAAIADFPVQFASLAEPLGSFVDMAFSGTRLDPAPFLRGIYFASGTQEGSPIDRLTGTLARNFGIDQRQAAVLRPSQGRGYFLDSLLKQVVFGEAMLVVRNPRTERRRMILRAAAWTVAGVVTIGSIAGLWLTARDVSGHQQRFDNAMAAYFRAAGAAPLDPVPVGARDLPQVVPLLNQARAVVTEATDPAHGGSGFGLAQREKNAEAANMVYRRALERMLLPRLVSLLEARIRGKSEDLDTLYRATRVYLILCGKGLMDQAMVREWMRADWAEAYAGASQGALRNDLATHLDALLSRFIGEFVVPDPDLLARAQAKLGSIGVADRAYALLRSSDAARTPPPFIPAEAIGAGAGAYFVRSSGRPMTEPVPGLYTVAGYRSAMLGPEMARVTDQALRESWVLGQASALDPNDVTARQKIEHDVNLHYARDYQAVWDGLLNDIEMVPPGDSATAAANFELLTLPTGPIKRFLLAAVKQFALSEPPPAAPGAPPALAVRPDPAVKDVEAHFHELRDYVEKGDIDAILAALGKLQQEISSRIAANAATGGPAFTAGADPAQTLQKMATRAPQPVVRWLQTLGRSGGAVRDDATRQQATAAYSGPGGAQPLCQQVVQKFPFRPVARDDVPLDSFAELFGPSGRFDEFFTRFVRPFVDIAPKDWKLRDSANTQTPVTAEGVAQFQRAMTIRDTFFSSGGVRPPPQVRFSMRPLPLDADATDIKLDFGGISAAWTQAATNVALFEWSGPTRMTDVRAEFSPAGSGADLQQTGPWALYRLFNQGKLDKVGNGQSYILTLKQGERQARFDLSANTAHSPFDFELLTGFKCPALRP